MAMCVAEGNMYRFEKADKAGDYIISLVKTAEDVSQGYVVKGQRLNRFGVEAGAGVTFYLSPDVESSVGYEGKFRSHYQDHTGYVSAKYKF